MPGEEKFHYIEKAELSKEAKHGGPQAIDFDFMNGILEINWK